ncbi:NUDIX domain-containing protein [Streptomyces sp. MS19]|uniref:NUDIX domain-containing protein n=1 Tax=Streptomyces sp. MS19 TaxID=3385972 RepID=UPI0039A0EB88
MHDSADFTAPPGRRLGALALFRNVPGEVRLVEKAYKSGPGRWSLPGGCAKEGEPAPVACQREMEEETGLCVVPGRTLLIHHMPAENDSKEGVNVVFDCGMWPEDHPVALGPELTSYRRTAPQALPRLVAPYTQWRIAAALHILNSEAPQAPGVPYLVGHAPTAT